MHIVIILSSTMSPLSRIVGPKLPNEWFDMSNLPVPLPKNLESPGLKQTT